MKTATLLRDLSEHFQGTAHLYRLSEPVVQVVFDADNEGTTIEVVEYVIVSASDVPWSGPETYMFPANEDAEVVSWEEMDGSFRGSLDHREALSNLGYEVAVGELA